MNFIFIAGAVISAIALASPNTVLLAIGLLVMIVGLLYEGRLGES